MDITSSFVEFALQSKVLQFGEFTLKSGRVSPYFFNAGLFNSGLAIAKLGQFYARRLIESGETVDMLFGPAYKGIPIATSTAIAYQQLSGRDIPIAFNRKEVKDHGEGGRLMGAQIAGRVAIIDDVITAGTAVREAINMISQAGGKVTTVMVALDRLEQGPNGHSAVQEVEQQYGLRVVSISTLNDLIRHAGEGGGEWSNRLEQLTAYRDAYGIK